MGRLDGSSAADQDAIEEIISLLANRAPSFLHAHPTSCCRIAEAWFRSMARSMSAQQNGPPTWIREKWEWGPTQWPLHWCEAVASERLDCGALAALSGYASQLNGETALPLQLVERFDRASVEGWQEAWRSSQSSLAWTWGEFIYHEATALLVDGRISVWDPTEACWVDGKPTAGYSSIVAVRVWPRVGDQGEAPGSAVAWREHSLEVGKWQRL